MERMRMGMGLHGGYCGRDAVSFGVGASPMSRFMLVRMSQHFACVRLCTLYLGNAQRNDQVHSVSALQLGIIAIGYAEL